MVFEMPEEISGQKNRNVVCQGRVIRSNQKDAAAQSDRAKPAADSEIGETVRLAASIVDYKFIR
jgi:hypothetical protein